MFIYYQSTHKLFHNNKVISTTGYSGHGVSKNIPADQNIKSQGPCPVGLYDISDAFDDPKHGPMSFRLHPDVCNEMFNRDGMMIHPDSIEHPGQASEGCICQDKTTRLYIKTSGDKRLVVLP